MHCILFVKQQWDLVFMYCTCTVHEYMYMYMYVNKHSPYSNSNYLSSTVSIVSNYCLTAVVFN